MEIILRSLKEIFKGGFKIESWHIRGKMSPEGDRVFCKRSCLLYAHLVTLLPCSGSSVVIVNK